jgi:hypothetical protein
VDLAQLWVVVKVGPPQPESDANQKAESFEPPDGMEGFVMVEPLPGREDHAAA